MKKGAELKMEIDILKEAKNVFDIEIAELEKLKSKLGDDFQKLVRMILELKNNNKVVVTGIGKSGIIGKKITATLASTGTTAVFINAAEALHGDLGMISDGDVVIAISNSGNSDEVLSILAPIKKLEEKLLHLLEILILHWENMRN
ncbi:SIS domain protein [Leptotrichia hofstadii F0254]|uniref:SIS domain protein n=1 Tax=Leptotrichia hofstadii F0254 TaxID=634994 RepID=C9MX73_9FUSO|nr:SIS domain protein [Leptotrichia hofstadii F0254]